MKKKSCGIPPSDRTAKGEKCENNQKKKYQKNGYDVFDLPQNAGADFAAVKGNTIILVEAKTQGGKQSSNQKETQKDVEKNGGRNIHYKLEFCDCKGRPQSK